MLARAPRSRPTAVSAPLNPPPMIAMVVATPWAESATSDTGFNAPSPLALLARISSDCQQRLRRQFALHPGGEAFNTFLEIDFR